MIAIMPQMRLLVAVEPVDFRRGIDGLVAVCRQRLQADPMGGACSFFGSRNRKSFKILAYDGQGFLLCQKRLSQGRFGWWPTAGAEAAWGWMRIKFSYCFGTVIPAVPRPRRCGGRLPRRVKRGQRSEKSGTSDLRSIF